MYNLCQSIPSFPKTKKLDESKFDMPVNRDQGFYAPEVRTLLPKIYNIDELTKDVGIKIPKRGKPIQGETDLGTDYLQIPYLVLGGKIKLSKPKKLMYNDIMDPNKPMFKSTGEQHLKNLNYGLIPGGFPQGMNMSPFLSMLALKNYLSQQDSTSYADDPIFYSNKTFDIMDEPENGIISSIEKSK